MGIRTGNPTWENAPSTNSPVSAEALNNIEGAIDASVATADLAEGVRDTMATALVAGTGITITPNDGADTITIAASGTSGIPATIVDAKGDLIAATGPDAVARLAVGSVGRVLRANPAQATGLEWSLASPVYQDAFDAKGDLLVATGDNAYATLSVGTNGQVLTADSAQSRGMRWADAAGAASLPFQRIPAVGTSATSSFFKSNTTGHLGERATAPMPLLLSQTITIDEVAFQLSTLAATPGQTGRIVLKELNGNTWTAGTPLVTNIALASPQTVGEKVFSITPVVLNAGVIYGFALFEDQSFDSTLRVIQGTLTGPGIGGTSGYGAGYDLPVGTNATIVSAVPMIRFRRSA